jgi:thioredoxin reductase (NADPH)
MEMIVVGAGPAGISMAVEAIRAGVQPAAVRVLEKGPEHSWAIRKFYPENKAVTANYKGQEAQCRGVLCIEDTTKSGVLSYLDRAIADHQIDVHYQQTVHAIRQRDGGGLIIDTPEGTLETRTCAIAIGILGKPNKPTYRIPPTLRTRVHFDVTSKKIENSRVLVVGGGDSASEYVQYLHEIGNQVTLSYRRDQLTRMNDINRESLLALVDRQQVTLRRSSNLRELLDSDGRPLVSYEEESLEDEAFDHVVYALGGTTPENFLKEIGIDFDGPAPIVTDGFETSVPGLFLIGDLSAGKKGGSIISAFNSANGAMRAICSEHLDCSCTSSS